MDFISNKEHQIQEMLTALGINDVEELFSAIPEKLRVARPTHDDGLSEFEGMQLMRSLAKRNTYQHYDNYLGAGAYEHHVPALVSAITSKSEFLTAYTPYQAEASQGLLQSIFEYQSVICALTGMDVSNASLYDGASACAEAVLMALRLQKKRDKVLVAGNLHPHYLSTIQLYLSNIHADIQLIPYNKEGQIENIEINDEVAAILIQSPNFFGGMENVKSLFDRAKEHGSLCILYSNPLAYGIYASAAEVGADIAIGDCQPLGLPLQFGGPYVGYMACKEKYVRQLPGRIVGETVDTKGNRGFVLTLQAREQHIRREKATSNICTNQALAALACLVTILWYGKEGIKQLALTNFQRTVYLKNQLRAFQRLSNAPHLNEFAIHFAQPAEIVQNHFRKHHIEPGVHLGKYYPEFDGYFLIAVTETKNKEQLDRYHDVAMKLREHVKA